MSDLAPSAEALRMRVRHPNDFGSLEETVRKAVARLYFGRSSFCKYRSPHEYASEVELALAGRHINALRAGGSQNIDRLGRDALEASLKRIMETSPVLRTLTPSGHRILVTEFSSEATMLKEASIHSPHPHLLTSKNTAHSLYTLFAAFSLDSTGGQVIDAWVTSRLRPLMEKVSYTVYMHDGLKVKVDPEVGPIHLALVQHTAPSVSSTLPTLSATSPDPVDVPPNAPSAPIPAPACSALADNPTAPSPIPLVLTPPASSTTASASTAHASSATPTPTTPTPVATKSEYRHKRKAVQYPESSEPHKKAKQTSGAPDLKPTAGASDPQFAVGASGSQLSAGAPDPKQIPSATVTTRIPGIPTAKRAVGSLDAKRAATGKRVPDSDAPGMKSNTSGAKAKLSALKRTLFEGKEDTPPAAGSSSAANAAPNPLNKPPKSRSMNLPSKLKQWR